MPRNILIAIVLLGVFCAPMAEAASLQKEFTTLAKTTRLKPEKQAACVTGPSGEALSYNSDIRIIPASVSKLYTFDWTLSVLAPDYRYKTMFIRNKNTLYINGTADPHFVVEHLRAVASVIKQDNPQQITKIVATKDFYYNWKSIAPEMATALHTSINGDPDLAILKGAVIITSDAPYTGKGTKYEFRSTPLIHLLKQVNNYSTNISADTLFARLGGFGPFALYMRDTYGAGSETISFINGSGLPGDNGTSNYTTCALTLRVLAHLEQTLHAKGYQLSDVLSMPTIDPGVLKDRAINSAYVPALLAKSGYVFFHHALAGAINTNTGPMYFALFTDYPKFDDGPKVKSMIDTFVNKILSANALVLKSYNYTPDPSIFEQFEVVKK